MVEQVTYLGVNSEGMISLEELEAAMRPETVLVSVMAVNNEIGEVHGHGISTWQRAVFYSPASVREC